MGKKMRSILVGLILTVSFISGADLAADTPGNIEGKVKVTRTRTSADVVVYLELVGENNFDPPKEHAVMDQKKLTFLPHVLPILKGTTVDFMNSDDVKHNIFSREEVADKFNLGTYAKGMVKTHTFNKSGEAILLCNVHSDMEAYIVVMPNPYFAKTDKTGNFKIENVPPGNYTLKTWHEKKKSLSQEVNVEAGNATIVNLTLSKRR